MMVELSRRGAGRSDLLWRVKMWPALKGWADGSGASMEVQQVVCGVGACVLWW